VKSIEIVIILPSRNHPVFPVVSQSYETQPIDEYVIVGNDALFKCTIPSYVSDFVTVVGWVDNEGGAILPAFNGNAASDRRTR
jgi:hypothetical protein